MAGCVLSIPSEPPAAPATLLGPSLHYCSTSTLKRVFDGAPDGS
jgi:hypothetical protein